MSVFQVEGGQMEGCHYCVQPRGEPKSNRGRERAASWSDCWD